jgi:hypothetical protein
MLTSAGCWCKPDTVFVMCKSESPFRFSKHERSYTLCDCSVGYKGSSCSRLESAAPPHYLVFGCGSSR